MHSGRSWTFRNRRTAPAALSMTGPAGPTARSAAVLSHLVAGEMTRAARQQPADGRTPPSPALPRLAAAVPGPMTEADPSGGHRVRSPRAAGNHDDATGTRWCCLGCHQRATTSACEPATGRAIPGSGADACRSRAGCAMLTGQIPPTNRQRMIKRPDRRPGDQASDLHLLVAGAGFEPATSGL
jgi:hypothetical protein